jgi:pyruvate dehydrogenase E1 component beta subunit
MIAEQAFASLKAPIVRLGGPDAPVPSGFPLEQAFVPQAEAIAAAARRLCALQPA